MPSDKPHHLELPPAEMRRLGYRVVDEIVEHLSGLAERPVGRRIDRRRLEQHLDGTLPEEGETADAVLDEVLGRILPEALQVQHPRFFAFVPSPNNFVGVLADALVAGFNPFVGTWFAGSGPIGLELVTLDWLRQICGLPEGAGGLLVSGGSVANLTALTVARRVQLEDRLDGAVAYCSDQTHSAVTRAFRVLGLAAGQLRSLPTESPWSLDPTRLREAIRRDREEGLRPFCVVANAGTTNTGAVDPLAELAEICRQQDLWLHVDGAYGAAAALCEPGRTALAGLGEADSIALDPHKWLFQPFEIGCVLLRDPELLHGTFKVLPEYLRDTEQRRQDVNLSNYGIQLTRSFRALKLWMTFKVFGAGELRRAIARGLELAERAEAWLRSAPDWEVVTPAQLAVVTFRYAPPGLTEAQVDALQSNIVQALVEDGFALMTSTSLGGRTVLRLCTINPRTTERDLEQTLEKVEALALAQETPLAAG